MNSFLIGLSFMLYTVFRVLGLAFHDSWSFQWFGITLTPTCGIWFYLTNLVAGLAILSLLLLFILRWYKSRERDDITMSQMMVEEIYYK